MSIPDHELDEPSEAILCSAHGWVRPCPDCLDEMADQQYDMKREERHDR